MKITDDSGNIKDNKLDLSDRKFEFKTAEETVFGSGELSRREVKRLRNKKLKFPYR